MRKKRHTPEEIIRKLREAEVALAQGQTAVQVSPSPRPVLVSCAAFSPPTPHLAVLWSPSHPNSARLR